MKQYQIGKNDAGQRLDRFTAKTVPKLPDSLLQKYIRLKRIKINNKGAKRDTKLVQGDTVQMYINDEFFYSNSEEAAYLQISKPTLDIIYEDDNILLVNKRAGILCHSGAAITPAKTAAAQTPAAAPAKPPPTAAPASTPPTTATASTPPTAAAASTPTKTAAPAERDTLISHIQAYLYQKGQWRPQEEHSFAPALCNRIDRNTSGIVIAAKNAESLRIINEKIKLREIDKYYLAAVHGTPSPPSGTLENQIFKDSTKNVVYIKKSATPGSKTAITEYKTIKTSGQLSLLECRLLTGRTHQIRAQLAEIGHPLLGDGKYGSERLNKPYGEKYQSLCSYKLAFAYKTDAGLLQYLDNKTFTIKNIPFADKYFP